MNRRRRFTRWLRYDAPLPTLDGCLVFAGLVTLLAALAVLLTILAGIYGHGPLAHWWRS